MAKPLTSAEIAVMDAICEGKTNREIAAERGKSPSTVKVQVSRVLDKLGAQNRAEAVAIWLRPRHRQPC